MHCWMMDTKSKSSTSIELISVIKPPDKSIVPIRLVVKATVHLPEEVYAISHDKSISKGAKGNQTTEYRNKKKLKLYCQC